jgi:hypothetical protein
MVITILGEHLWEKPSIYWIKFCRTRTLFYVYSVVCHRKKYSTKFKESMRLPDVNKAYLEQGKLRLVYWGRNNLAGYWTFLVLCKQDNLCKWLKKDSLKVGCIRRDCLAARFYYGRTIKQLAEPLKVWLRRIFVGLLKFSL